MQKNWSFALRGLLGLLACAVVCLSADEAQAQLDTRHWIPPMVGYGAVNQHCLFLFTPEPAPVNVAVTDGAGTEVWTGTVSKASPVIVEFRGNCGGSAVGFTGPSTIDNALLGTTNLNTINDEGVFVVADRPVYANFRHRSSPQSGSLTAKGRKALGTEFRAGFMYAVDNNSGTEGPVVSVMATQDDTTVTFDDFKPGVTFEGQPTSGNPATSDPITVVLDAGESYIIGSRDSALSTPDINDYNGMRITSDKPIASNSGCWLQGPTSSGRDIGIDQQVPVDLAGREFVLVRGNGGSTNLETVIVVATVDDTNVTANGDATPTCSGLQAGEYCVLQGLYQNDGMLVETTRPSLVYQTIGGSTSGATPGMNVVPQLAGSPVTAVEPLPTVEFIGAATLGLVTRASATLTINGSAPTQAAQAVAGTTDWVVYKVPGQTGTLDIVSTASLAVALFNVSGPIGSAGYFSGFPDSNNDFDNDGVPDGDDNCPDDPNPNQADADFDGVGDACDGCPNDPGKAAPGLCGCGVIEGDPDNDGVVCTDNCPFTPNPNQDDADQNGVGDACEDDADNDGTPDAQDGCPNDPNKIDPGQCGCGLPDTDSDLDGTANCTDECPSDPNKTLEGQCGCGVPEGTCGAPTPTPTPDPTATPAPTPLTPCADIDPAPPSCTEPPMNATVINRASGTSVQLVLNNLAVAPLAAPTWIVLGEGTYPAFNVRHITTTPATPLVITAACNGGDYVDVTVDGQVMTGETVRVSSVSNVTLKGFAVSGAHESGVTFDHAHDSSAVAVTSNYNRGHGFFVDDSTGIAITDGLAQQNGRSGVRVRRSPGTVILRGSFPGNRESGISVEASSDVLVDGAALPLNGSTTIGSLNNRNHGVVFWDGSMRGTVRGAILCGNAEFGAFFWNSPDGVVEQSVARENGLDGIKFYRSSGSSARCNRAHSNGQFGVLVRDSDGASILHNLLDGNVKGVALTEASTGVTVFNNLAVRNAEAGIAIHRDSSAEIRNNTAADSTRGNGIEFVIAGLGSTLGENIIAFNNGAGIYGADAANVGPNLVHGNGSDYAFAVPGAGDIDADPLFVADYLLSQPAPLSPAVDAGLIASAATAPVPLNAGTTDVAEALDAGLVDLGFHRGLCGWIDLPEPVDPSNIGGDEDAPVDRSDLPSLSPADPADLPGDGFEAERSSVRDRSRGETAHAEHLSGAFDEAVLAPSKRSPAAMAIDIELPPAQQRIDFSGSDEPYTRPKTVTGCAQPGAGGGLLALLALAGLFLRRRRR